jgi:hypothetical protein
MVHLGSVSATPPLRTKPRHKTPGQNIADWKIAKIWYWGNFFNSAEELAAEWAKPDSKLRSLKMKYPSEERGLAFSEGWLPFSCRVLGGDGGGGGGLLSRLWPPAAAATAAAAAGEGVGRCSSGPSRQNHHSCAAWLDTRQPHDARQPSNDARLTTNPPPQKRSRERAAV